MVTSLAALQTLRPVKTPDFTQRHRTLADARASQQTEQLRGLQIEGAENDLAAEQAAREKATAIHQVLVKYRGNIEEALPEINQLDPVLGNALAKTGADIAEGKERVQIQKDTLEATERKNAQDHVRALIEAGRKASEPTILSPGSGIIPPGETKPSYTQPFKTETPVPGRDVPFSPEIEEQRKRIANESRAPRQSEPLEAILGPDGKAVLVPRSQAAGKTPAPSSQSKPPTEGERTALRFYERMKGAADDLARVEEKIAGKGAAGQIFLKFAPNLMQPEENQLYQQAQRAFTEARLRKDSGAAIPESEFENDRRTYFAQPGDSKAVLEQKRKSRETALGALRRSAARAYEETYGESPNNPGKTGPADPLGIR